MSSAPAFRLFKPFEAHRKEVGRHKMHAKPKKTIPEGAIPVSVSTVTLLKPIEKASGASGEKERVSLSGVGYLLLSEESKTLVYESKEGDGVTETTLTLAKRCAHIVRSGSSASDMWLCPDKTTESTYSVPPFSFPLAVTLHSLSDELSASGGRLRLSYRMELGGERSEVSFLLKIEKGAAL